MCYFSGDKFDGRGNGWEDVLLETRACAAVSWACSGSSGCVCAIRSLRRSK